MKNLSRLLILLIGFGLPSYAQSTLLMPTNDATLFVPSTSAQEKELLKLANLIDMRLANIQAQQAESPLPYPEIEEIFTIAESAYESFLETLFFTGLSNNMLIKLMDLEGSWALHHPLIAQHAIHQLLQKPLSIVAKENVELDAFARLIYLTYESQIMSQSTNNPMALILAVMERAKKDAWTLEEQLDHWSLMVAPLSQGNQAIEQEMREEIRVLLEDLAPVTAIADQIFPKMQALVQDRRMNAFYQDILTQATHLFQERAQVEPNREANLLKTHFNQEAGDFDYLFMQEFDARFADANLPMTIKEQELKAWEFVVLVAFLHAQFPQLQARYDYSLQFFEIRELVLIVLEAEQQMQTIIADL
ncbi:hypothetical protein PVA46_07860 (plasmid) [Entomospira culicis]|nr:hypothetical protein PVA46_07860 [Entomospira culicis]